MAFPMKCKSVLFVCLLMFTLIAFNSNGQTKNDSISKEQDLVYQDSAYDLKESDTILMWKKNRQFAYMYYLDSLLRNQKNLRSDTVTFDENTGKIIRKRFSQNVPSAAGNMLNSLPLKIFFWMVAVAFILFIGYNVLFKSSIFKTRERRFKRTDPEEENVAELYDFVEYDSLISGAEKNNEFNTVIRYLFLKTLKTLSDKSFINFAPEKTNKDYLKEMSQNQWYEEFEKLTGEYEYAWYGKFVIGKNKYAEIKEQFEEFNGKI